MKFHHIGVACKDIEAEIENISLVHKIKEKSDIVFDELQNAKLCLLSIEGGPNIELISGEQVKNLIKKQINYYHICYEVDDINKEIERLTAEGGFLISSPKPAILFNNKEVAFLQLSYGMIELVNSN